MKLNARKSMVAMGTALALSLTPVAVPTMAPVAVAAVNETTFSSTWAKLKGKVTEVQVRVDATNKKIDDVQKKVAGYTAAEGELGTARVELSVASEKLATVKRELDSVAQKDDNGEYIKPEVTEDNQGWMNGALAELGTAETSLTKAGTAIDRAITEKKKADKDEFSCPGAVNADADDEGGSSGSSMDSFTSSGNRIIYKDGKKKCISNSEYFTDKLTKIVAVLGTIFTLITTVTKISDVMMKNNPIVPPAPAA